MAVQIEFVSSKTLKQLPSEKKIAMVLDSVKKNVILVLEEPLTLDEEQVKYWISKGAQPTDSIHNLLINKGVIQGKKVNALPKKTPQKSEEAIAAEAAAKIAAEAPAVEPTIEAPTEAEVIAEAEPAPEVTPVV